MELPTSYIALDIETTGLNSKRDKIVAIALVYVEEGKVLDKFYSLVDPKMEIPEDSYKIHGISDEMVQDEPDFVDLIEEVNGWIEGTDPDHVQRGALRPTFLTQRVQPQRWRVSGPMQPRRRLSARKRKNEPGIILPSIMRRSH